MEFKEKCADFASLPFSDDGLLQVYETLELSPSGLGLHEYSLVVKKKSEALLLASLGQWSGPALCTTAFCTETGKSKVGLGKEILVKLSAVIIMCPLKKIAWCSKTVMAWDYLNRSYFISLKWMQITELRRSSFLQFLEFCGFVYLLYTCYLPCGWIKQALYFLFYRPDQ